MGIFGNIPVTSEKSIKFYGGLAMAYRKQKRIDRILDCMREFKADISEGYSHWLDYNYTLIYRALDEKERMFEYLEICLIGKITPLIFIQVDPVWDEYRNDPVFKELIEKTFIPAKRGPSQTAQ